MVGGFRGQEQVEKQRAEVAPLQARRDEAVARAGPTAVAAMRKQHHAASRCGRHQGAGQTERRILTSRGSPIAVAPGQATGGGISGRPGGNGGSISGTGAGLGGCGPGGGRISGPGGAGGGISGPGPGGRGLGGVGSGGVGSDGAAPTGAARLPRPRVMMRAGRPFSVFLRRSGNAPRRGAKCPPEPRPPAVAPRPSRRDRATRSGFSTNAARRGRVCATAIMAGRSGGGSSIAHRPAIAEMLKLEPVRAAWRSARIWTMAPCCTSGQRKSEQPCGG
jgi:hypothetical protein